MNELLKNSWINCNYYDDEELYDRMYDFMIESLRTQINFGIDRTTGYVLGKKNFQFFNKINKQENFFENLVQLEHPRYIVQYKSKETDKYIAKYLDVLQC